MAKYNPVTPELLEELKKVVGASNVKTDAETLDRFKTDEETDPRLMHLPEVVVWVNSTEEVAAVMKLANQFVVPVTPRSAGTSVSDGAIPVLGGIVLNMEKMNKIIEINEDAMYAVSRWPPKQKVCCTRATPAARKAASSAATSQPTPAATRRYATAPPGTRCIP